MNYNLLVKYVLFRGMTEQEAKDVLVCLQAETKKYQKGRTIYHMGDSIGAMGVVLSGSVNIENDDIWGNKNILDNIGPGQVFGETYACLPREPLMVNVIAAETTEVLFLDVSRLLTTCPNVCGAHHRLVQNLLWVTTQKNLTLSRKIFHTTPKSIRGRLLSYLSTQAVRTGSGHFIVPFNRQQMADYLCVDRSAMSNELSKMKQEGLLDFHKNEFWIKEAGRFSESY